MGYLVVDTVHPGQVTDETDGDFLDDAENLVVAAVNLRPECLAEPHFDTDLDADAGDALFVTLGWIDSASGTGTSIHGDEDPGTDVAPGAVTLELLPPNHARATMQEGDTLRWHFGCHVDEVDYSGDAAADRYYVEVLVTGVDDNGTATKGAGDSSELGIVAGFSMNSAGIAADPNYDGSIKELSACRIHVSGMYLHQGQFTTDGGDVRISAIRVRIYVEDEDNEVTVSNATLTAMICKG